jgi:hypothetical protein
MVRSNILRVVTAMTVITLAGTGLLWAQPSPSERLPRQFQKARLGMAMEELVRVEPQVMHARPAKDTRMIHTVTVPARDPYLNHLEYRFYRGRLFEEAVYYKRDRLPRGYAGLVGRLRELYGRPASEDLIEFDPAPDSISSQKTVWKDARTRIALAEHRKMREGQEYYELVLTMTDLALEQARKQEEDALLREKEQRVPIPLPDGSARSKLSAGSGSMVGSTARAAARS